VLAGTFKQLADDGRLDIADIDLAVIQFYALVLYPHLVHSAYGVSLSQDITDGLIHVGVDMFLTYYHYQQATPGLPPSLDGDAGMKLIDSSTRRVGDRR
jgi:TetR/AcrR family transcriptional repressor of mexJK operon